MLYSRFQVDNQLSRLRNYHEWGPHYEVATAIGYSVDINVDRHVGLKWESVSAQFRLICDLKTDRLFLESETTVDIFPCCWKSIVRSTAFKWVSFICNQFSLPQEDDKDIIETVPDIVSSVGCPLCWRLRYYISQTSNRTPNNMTPA